MFKRLGETGIPVQFYFNGQPVLARSGDSVAAALMAADLRVFRAHPVSGSPRGAFCMMGACYECLVEIDGVTVQACQTVVSGGLVVSSPKMPGEVQ